MFPAPQFLRRKQKPVSSQKQRARQALQEIRDIVARVPGECFQPRPRPDSQPEESEALRNALSTTLRRIHQDIADLERAIATIRPLVMGTGPLPRTSGILKSGSPIRRIRVPNQNSRPSPRI